MKIAEKLSEKLKVKESAKSIASDAKALEKLLSGDIDPKNKRQQDNIADLVDELLEGVAGLLDDADMDGDAIVKAAAKRM